MTDSSGNTAECQVTVTITDSAAADEEESEGEGEGEGASAAPVIAADDNADDDRPLEVERLSEIVCPSDSSHSCDAGMDHHDHDFGALHTSLTGATGLPGWRLVVEEPGTPHAAISINPLQSRKAMLQSSSRQPGKPDTVVSLPVGVHTVSVWTAYVQGSLDPEPAPVCEFRVTVEDREKPVTLSCPQKSVQAETEKGQPYAEVSMAVPTASDNADNQIKLQVDLTRTPPCMPHCAGVSHTQRSLTGWRGARTTYARSFLRAKVRTGRPSTSRWSRLWPLPTGE